LSQQQNAEAHEDAPKNIVLDEVLAPDESDLLTPIPSNGAADDETLFIAVAADELDITRCYPVMAELRPHLDEDTFIRQVQRQQEDGYLLVYGEVGGEVVACAGFRVLENLASGRFLYVDDLVTCSACRSQGHGEALMNWLLDYARASNCSQFHLDSGVQRFEAHRFYFRQRMNISSYHFAMKL
jgi:GNAT superfamily N-acetyltransferase